MRILCLHGRGSNNDIFKMQTAGFRSLLDDYEFDFVQGQMPHIEGNWSLHTRDFASSKLWGYFNMLDLSDVRETERELLQLVAEEGPYDGILGYSQGATLAAQVLIRHAMDNPGCPEQEWPFRFAVFINGATPSRVLQLTSKPPPILPDLTQPLALKFLHAMKANPLLHQHALYPAHLPGSEGGGRQILADGSLALMKCDSALDGKLIRMPTLHVRCASDEPEHGEELYHLCETRQATQYFHCHRHDFPRGYDEMRQIARLIRQTAEKASEPRLP